MMSCRFIWLCVALACPGGLGAADNAILDEVDRYQVEEALRALNMTTRDLGFKKEMADSALILPAARWALREPLWLTEYADQWRVKAAGVSNVTSLVNAVVGGAEAQSVSTGVGGSAHVLARNARLPGPVREAAHILYEACVTAAALLKDAWPADQLTGWSAAMAQVLELDADHEAGVKELADAGFDVSRMRALLRDQKEMRSAEDDLARPLVELAGKMDKSRLDAAMLVVSRAVDAAVRLLRQQPVTDEFSVVIETPLGMIFCGGSGANVYREEALLILDTGGDDVYECRAGFGSVLVGRPVSIVLDMGGNDRYVSGRSFSQGSGVLGIGVLVDAGGDDVYTARDVSQGAGVFGYGILVDGEGRDVFDGGVFVQGAGMLGAGVLWQGGGNTQYRAGRMAQGAGGVLGVGWLLDGDGQDVYVAGGVKPCPWLPGQFFSLAQGFGIGMRPFLDGGVGVLTDLKGHDRYVADVYGQGASYWHSVGLLVDVEGNDFYQAYQYCQGAGIHLSSGLLADLTGDDQYAAQAICQGGAHDYAVGLLVDRAGNDRYLAQTTAQGAGINNAVGILLDRAGNDFYAGRDPQQSQATGHDGGRREYGSIALMLDLGGTDAYSQGQTNNMAWLKPKHGAGCDMELTGSDAVKVMMARETASRELPEAKWLEFARADPDHPVERLFRLSVSDHPDAGKAWDQIKAQPVESLRYLVSRLDSPSVMVRVKTEQLVDQMGMEAIPVLVEGLGNERETVRRLSCFFLARFGEQGRGDNRYREPVLRGVMAMLEKETTRAVALHTLGHLRASECMARAEMMLGDADEMVRMRAAQALGRLRNRRSLPALVEKLGDDSWMVRYAVEDALVELGRENISPLRRMYEKSDDRSKAHMVMVMARWGDERALALGERLWRDEAPWWREARLRQLREAAPVKRPTVNWRAGS